MIKSGDIVRLRSDLQIISLTRCTGKLEFDNPPIGVYNNTTVGLVIALSKDSCFDTEALVVFNENDSVRLGWGIASEFVAINHD